jgi:hypothetical protein
VQQTYRVCNLTRGEIRAELHEFEQAKQLADQLAANEGHKDVWAVVTMLTVYETRITKGETT